MYNIGEINGVTQSSFTVNGLESYDIIIRIALGLQTVHGVTIDIYITCNVTDSAWCH
jgi:hypothetical protein